MSPDQPRKEALDGWVYIEPRQRLTFDQARIDAHGKAHLARSLQSRKLIGVLGSGLSRVYGMPGWEALLKNTAQIVVKEIKTFNPPAGPIADRQAAHIETLIQRFQEQGLDDPSQAQDPENFIYNFELTENLFSELYVYSLGRKGKDLKSRSGEAFRAKSFLRARLKWQLQDLRGRLEIFLTEDLIRKDLDSGLPSEDPYTAALETIRFPGRIDERLVTMDQQNAAVVFTLLFYKDVKDVEQIITQLHGPDTANLVWRARRLKASRRLSSPLFDLAFTEPLPPSTQREDQSVQFAHRFDTSGALTSRTHWDVRDIIDASFVLMTKDEKREYLAHILAITNALSSDPELVKVLQKRARAHHPSHLDPIAILHRDLGIRRFVTTNYDAEFDKWLEALDYDPIVQTKDAEHDEASAAFATAPRGTRSLMVDPFGNRAEIMAYEPGSAPDLFSFGVDTRDFGIHVLHLHGRIRRPESWLVLSEPDYQARYARDGEPTAQNDDAMRLIFNSNPLLFVGLGMKEADILRPLRSYSQGDASLADRPSIALKPRLANPRDTRAEQSKAMSTYGIFNLYYGDAVVETVMTVDGIKQAPERSASNESALRDCLNAINSLRAYVDDPDMCDGWVTKTNALATLKTIRDDYLSLDTEPSGREKKFVTVEESKQHALTVNYAMGMLLRIADALHLDQPDIAVFLDVSPAERRALGSLLDGISNMVFSSFFCARLTRMVRDVESWQTDWGGASKPRERFGQSVSDSDDPPNPLPFESDRAMESIRQVVILRDLEVEKQRRQKQLTGNPDKDSFHVAPRTDRFFAGHPSPAIITLRAALTDARIGTPTTKRLLLMLGDRGNGRGHVFAAMRSPTRFAYICDWLKIPNPSEEPFTGKHPETYTARIPRAFYNLGLSHEVLSVFDRLIQFLQDILANNMPPRARRANEAQLGTVQNDRARRLEYILEKLNEIGKMPHTDRIVICINNVDNLFNADGQAKNSQLEILISLLADTRFKHAPIDLILFMSRSPLPRLFQSLSQTMPFQALCADVDTPSYRNRYITHLDRLGVTWSNEDLRSGTATDGESWIFTHKLHPMRPVTFAIRFFPKVAIALYYLGKKTQAGTRPLDPESNESLVNYTFNADRDVQVSTGLSEKQLREIIPPEQEFCSTTRQYMDMTLRDAFDKGLQIEGYDIPKIRQYAKIFTTDSIETLSLSLIQNHFDSAAKEIRKQERQLKRLRNRFQSSHDRQVGDDYHKMLHKFEEKNTLKAREYIEQHIAKYLNGEDTWNLSLAWADYYFRKLHRAVGHNRYCLTVVFAAIDDMIERRLNSFPEGVVELMPVLKFMERLSLACSGQTPHVRVEMAIDQVLLNYKTDIFNSYGTPMAGWPQSFREAYVDVVFGDTEDVVKDLLEVGSPLIFELQETILAALTLIGQPIPASALLGVGTVALSFERLFNAIHLSRTPPDATPGQVEAQILNNRQKQRCIDLVMDLLVHRCLAFRLYPKNRPDKEEYHFAVHSAVKRYYLSNMGAPNVDYASIDQLTVSMYTSQPNEMPKPTAETNRRIRSLIEGLSQYEGQPFHAFRDPFFDPEVPDSTRTTAKDRADFQRMRLRAALGPLRSFCSVGVVSRFSSYQGEGVHPPDAGYFETHRRRVRWLLRKAHELDTSVDESEPTTRNLNRERYSFYAEEQVWLFNECGVISLAQGRINDAISLLIQARLIAQQFVEGSGWGSLHTRVSLNLALASIEAGKLRDARDLLTKICVDPNETRVIHAVAAGYMARIVGLQCNFTAADAQIAEAIDVLTQTKRFRAAALLLIHRAEILGEMGHAHLHLADQCLLSARDLASNGGHEDVRQLSLLAYYRLMTQRLKRGDPSADKQTIQQGLAPLFDYARTMNMPSMHAGAALTEAQLLFDEGEYLAASEAAQRALLNATRFNLELVKIDALHLLGGALLKLGMQEAKNLLIRAREIAIHCEYNVKINAIEALLSGTAQ